MKSRILIIAIAISLLCCSLSFMSSCSLDGKAKEEAKVIPTALPDGSSYEIYQRFDFDSADKVDLKSVDGAKISWTSEEAINGGALRLDCSADMEEASQDQRKIPIEEPFWVEDVKGLLWYVDLSGVKKASDADAVSASVSMGETLILGTTVPDEVALCYYYKDGAWVQSTVLKGGGVSLPEGFNGWIYAPISSYNGTGDMSGCLYDKVTGLGLPPIFVVELGLYADGYAPQTDKAVIFDEIIFVK